MTTAQSLADRFREITALMREIWGVRAADLGSAQGVAKRRLPRRLYKDVVLMARAEPLADHPKLGRTLDEPELRRAAASVESHLNSIDRSDQRKGWWLGLLGGLAFNMLAFVALVIAVLIWRGYL